MYGASSGSSCTTYGRPDRSTAARHSTSSIGIVARLTLHVSVLRAARDGSKPDAHHVVEAQFKAFSRALREAVEIDPRNAGQLPSTKGVL